MFDAEKARKNTNNYMTDNIKDILERIEEESKEGMSYYNVGAYLSATEKSKLKDLGFYLERVKDNYEEDQWYIKW
jgi:hypothetical protein